MIKSNYASSPVGEEGNSRVTTTRKSNRLMETTYHDLVQDVRAEIYRLLADDHTALYVFMRVSRFARGEMLPYLRSNKVTINSINEHIGKHGHLGVFKWLRDRNRWHFRLDTLFYNALASSKEGILAEIKIIRDVPGETKYEVWTDDDLYIIPVSGRGGKILQKIKVSKRKMASHIGQSTNSKIIETYSEHTSLSFSDKSTFWIIVCRILLRDDLAVFKYFFPIFSGSDSLIIRGDDNSFASLCIRLTRTWFRLYNMIHLNGAVEIHRYVLERPSAKCREDIIREGVVNSYHPNAYKLLSDLIASEGRPTPLVPDLSIFNMTIEIGDILTANNPFKLKLYFDLGGGYDFYTTAGERKMCIVMPPHSCTINNAEIVMESELDYPAYRNRLNAYREFFEMVAARAELFDLLFSRGTITVDILNIMIGDCGCALPIMREAFARDWIDLNVDFQQIKSSFPGTSWFQYRRILPKFIKWLEILSDGQKLILDDTDGAI